MQRRIDWRAEAPWLLLLGSALLAPALLRHQGGDWHAAISAGLACLVAPAAGILPMLALAHLAGGGPSPGRQR